MGSDELDWNLDDILCGQTFEELCTQLNRGIKQYSRHFRELKPTMSKKRFAEFLIFEQEVIEVGYRLDVFTQLKLLEKPDSSELQREREKVEILLQKRLEAANPFDVWIAGHPPSGKLSFLDKKNYARLRSAVPGLESMIEETRIVEVNNPENKLFEGAQEALIELYHVLDSELRYEYKNLDTGESANYVYNELKTKLFSIDRQERKRAQNSLVKTFQENIEKFFLIYRGIVKNQAETAKRKGYNSSFAMQCDDMDTTDREAHRVLKTTEDHLDVFKRFFKYRAKLLGSEKIELYDISLQPEIGNLELPDGLKMILDAFASFSPEFSTEAEKVIQEKHLRTIGKIDSSMAFSVSPRVTAYVQISLNKDFGGYEDLAHELGHAAHFGLSRGNWPSVFEAGNLLAETASTFGELLFLDELHKTKFIDKKCLLETKIDLAYQNIAKYFLITSFELKSHQAITTGASEKEVSEIYAELFRKHLGDVVNLTPDIGVEWIKYDVFSEPFYSYSYCFGFYAALPLYQQYKNDGASFTPKLLEVWKTGGTQDPKKLLKSVGVNLNSKKTLENTFKIINQWMDELEQT